ncbi:hypothetical protein RUM44_002030 [Polyplax serrata]|uniref:Uncharacterized protein n=1 Tax=Polyplax serrata TaxID=468196 RepID=A0ABR1ALR3_POLSC
MAVPTRFWSYLEPYRHQEEVSNRQDKSDEKLVISAVAQRQTDDELSGGHSEKGIRNVRKRWPGVLQIR